jgi:TPR repeat protein
MFYAGKTCLLRSRASDSIPWFQESAARYYAPAQYRLAIAYLYGVGVSPDKAKGNSCLLEAVEAGHLLARGLLARRQLMGAFGLLKIPYGALTAVRTLIDIYRHAQRGDVFDEATSG